MAKIMWDLISDMKREFLESTEMLEDFEHVPGMSDDSERGVEENYDLLPEYNNHPRTFKGE